MSNRARDRHFQAAVLRKLYPPQPFYDDDLHLPHNDNQVEHKQIIEVPEIVRDVPSEDETNSRVSDSQSDSGESIGQHLTRAQRKRIRKRKRKEAVSSSKKLIGPLLPDNHVRENSPTETPKGLVTECSDTHTGNTMSDAVRSADLSEGLGSLTFHVKLKQRRLAKKLNNKSARSAQRENSSKVFMAESCETGYVLKPL